MDLRVDHWTYCPISSFDSCLLLSHFYSMFAYDTLSCPISFHFLFLFFWLGISLHVCLKACRQCKNSWPFQRHGRCGILAVVKVSTGIHTYQSSCLTCGPTADWVDPKLLTVQSSNLLPLNKWVINKWSAIEIQQLKLLNQVSLGQFSIINSHPRRLLSPCGAMHMLF